MLIILIILLCFQFFSIYFFISLIKISKKRCLWGFLAITLIALQCTASLVYLFGFDSSVDVAAFLAGSLSLTISALTAFAIKRTIPVVADLHTVLKRLRESETRYRTIFENVPVSIWEGDFSALNGFFTKLRREGVTDLETHFVRHPEQAQSCINLIRVIHMNRAARALHGATGSTELPVAIAIADTFTAESLQSFREELVCLWRGETEISRDAMLKTPASGLRHVTVTATVCPGYEATLARVLVSLVDITEHKRVEKQCLLRERAYRTLAENTPDLLVRYDTELRCIYVNPAWEKATGLSAAEVLNVPLTKIPKVPQPVVQKYLKALEQTLAHGTHSVVDFTWQNVRDEKLYLQYVVIPETDPDGNLVSLLAVGRDVTHYKQAERGLKRRERMYHTLVDNLPDCIIRFDARCRLLFVNSAVEKMFGAPREDFLEKSLAEAGGFGPNEQNRKLEQSIRGVFASGVPERREVHWETYHGPRIFEVQHLPERDEQGRVTSVLGIAHDITEHRQAEQEHRRYTDLLSNMDRIHSAIQKSKNLDVMMRNVLDETLAIFDCDRVYLLCPCNPDADFWTVPMERNKPDYPRAGKSGIKIPMDSEISQKFRLLLDTGDVVTFGAGTGYSLPEKIAARFGFKSMMATILDPKLDKPWEFGLQQCAYARIWTSEEKLLLRKISWRLGDALSSFLALENLRKSEVKYRQIVDTALEGVWVLDADTRASFVNARVTEMIGYEAVEILGRPASDFMFEEDVSEHRQKMRNRRMHIAESYERRLRRKNGSTLWTIISASPIFTDDGSFGGSCAMLTDITARKQAEQRLRQTLAFTEGVINAIPDVLLEVNAEGRYLNVWTRNPELLAAPKEVLLGRTVREVLPPEAAAVAMKGILEANEKGLSFGNIIRLELPDGSHWFEQSLSKKPDPEPGTEPRFLVLSRDVTQRIRGEEAQRASERRFRALFEQSFQFIGLLSTDGVLMEANRTALAFLGSEESEVLGEYFWDTAWWSHSSELQQRLRTAVREAAHGELVRFEATHIKSDGSTRYIDFSLKPVIDSDGRVVQLIPEGRDITERKLAEDNLKASEERFRAIFREAGLGIALLGTDDRIIQANPALERLLGCDGGQLEGRIFKQLFVYQNYNCLSQHPSVPNVKKNLLNDDCILFDESGRERVVHVLLSPVRDDDGNTVFTVALVDDLTERRAAETREAELQARLAHIGRVGLMGELTATLAHELNNPLGIIANYASGCVKRIKAGTAPDSLLPVLEKIGMQARGAGDIIQHVRSFVAKTEPTQGMTDITDVIEQSLEFLDARLQRAHITIDQELSADLPPVVMPLIQLQQVFLNLLMNAIDALREQDEEPRRIRVSARPNGTDKVEITVADNGALMHIPPNLFEPFYTTKPSGLGMGLAICHTLVEKHGGRIWATLERRHGLCIHFTLPAVTTEQKP